MAYRIEYTDFAAETLRALSARQRETILDRVESLMADQPTLPTRNRKPMRPNRLASWELRIDELRVYYDVEEHPEQLVIVQATGVKKRNEVWIGGKKVQL